MPQPDVVELSNKLDALNTMYKSFRHYGHFGDREKELHGGILEKNKNINYVYDNNKLEYNKLLEILKEIVTIVKDHYFSIDYTDQDWHVLKNYVKTNKK